MATQIYASITADNVGDFKKQLADLYIAHFPNVLSMDTRLSAVVPQVRLLAAVPASAPVHTSDCALHNGPALPIGPCDCGAEPAKDTVSQDTSPPLPAAPEPTQAPKKRGRKSNAEKAAEAAAAAHQANPEPATAPLACSHYRANPSDDCPQCNLEEPVAPAPAEDPMPQEKPGEDLFPIPDFLKREQPAAKPDAPAPTDRNVGFAPRDHARDYMRQLMDKKGMNDVIAALGHFGAKRISELADDKIAAFCEHVASVLEVK